MGFFKNRAKNKVSSLEANIWLDRARSWIPFGFQFQHSYLHCDACPSSSLVTDWMHGGLKVWVDPTADGARQQSSLTQDNAVYFFQHLNDYYYTRGSVEDHLFRQMPIERLESIFLTSTPHEAKAAEAIADLLEGLTAAPTAGEDTSLAARPELELEQLRLVSEGLLAFPRGPGLVVGYQEQQCESKHTHKSLTIYPSALGRQMGELVALKSMAMHIYKCENKWYASLPESTVHIEIWETTEQFGDEFVNLMAWETVENMIEFWKGRETPDEA